ncbi:MAG: hypothetical protein QOE61_1109 [Micromonosporaceae bacterium]|jgi:3'-phosphoadenosine 5'-phosphosulfate sulfotransferase (PAPS reductase)/FAD synthetase|nr:hypothetical protein [Micromonosporaceae bacterium]
MTTSTLTRSGPTPDRPALNVLSLGAGQQSSTLLLLACHGRIPRFDVARFADTGWEPQAVNRHLDRLAALATDAGIEVCRVGIGDIRADALDPAHRFASMPLFTLGPDGRRGLARRQCTTEYKINPLKREVRRRLGYPHPARVPAWVWARMSIGISVEEVGRVRDSDVRHMRNAFPLLDLGWRRHECQRYLAAHGLGDTPRSSCVGCPFHTDDVWARHKSDSPAECDDAVAFDHAIGNGSPRANANGQPLRGTFYLHASRVPLDQVPLRPRAGAPDGPGCVPWTCPHTPPVGEVA